ncbi:MAG: substrate-binding domain-containing protein [Actinomycetota bacterium]|nr:substrate-binding domain-containing protein [Actinomycetota bacterium]
MKNKTALNEVETILQAHPDLDVILTTNDPGAFGAASAIQAAGKEGEVKIFAVGGELRLGEMILEGIVESLMTLTPRRRGEKWQRSRKSFMKANQLKKRLLYQHYC